MKHRLFCLSLALLMLSGTFLTACRDCGFKTR